MPIAVGVIETQGFPTVLACADAMVKAARVTLVQYSRAESGRHFVAIRGEVAEVRTALAAGIEAGEQGWGGGETRQVITHYIVPNPPENLESVLPIDFSEASELFRG